MNSNKIIEDIFNGSIHRLSHVYRFSSFPTIRKENVAEHSWYVCLYSWIISDYLESKSIKINRDVLLSRALIHDIDEAHTGDFLRIVKYKNKKISSALKKLSNLFIDEIDSEYESNFKEYWEKAKSDDLEGIIISFADLLRVMSYVKEEEKLGNTHISHIKDETKEYLIILKKKIIENGFYDVKKGYGFIIGLIDSVINFHA